MPLHWLPSKSECCVGGVFKSAPKWSQVRLSADQLQGSEWFPRLCLAGGRGGKSQGQCAFILSTSTSYYCLFTLSVFFLLGLSFPICSFERRREGCNEGQDSSLTAVVWWLDMVATGSSAKPECGASIAGNLGIAS